MGGLFIPGMSGLNYLAQEVLVFIPFAYLFVLFCTQSRRLEAQRAVRTSPVQPRHLSCVCFIRLWYRSIMQNVFLIETYFHPHCLPNEPLRHNHFCSGCTFLCMRLTSQLTLATHPSGGGQLLNTSWCWSQNGGDQSAGHNSATAENQLWYWQRSERVFPPNVLLL